MITKVMIKPLRLKWIKTQKLSVWQEKELKLSGTLSDALINIH